MNAKEMIMTRSTIATSFTIAAVTALALSLAPTAKADDKGCSNASLNGTFAVTTTGYSVAAPDPVGPAFGQVSMQAFDGNGGTTDAGMVNSNGQVGQVNKTGTYTVNPDCTGTFTMPVGQGHHSTWFFVIADNWNEIRAICVDPFAVLTKIGRRIYPGRNM